MENPQLYDLFQEFKKHINSKDDLGLLVGYCVVGGALETRIDEEPSKVDTSFRQRIQFQQVRGVYTLLERALEFSAEYRGDEDDIGFATFCEVSSDVEEIIRTYCPRRTKAIGFKDILLGENIFEIIDGHRDYKDRVRRSGLKLLESVFTRRKVDGRRNSMLEDFGRITDSFVRER
jgi:hypothetical protein